MLLGADEGDKLTCGEEGWEPSVNPGPRCVELKCNTQPSIQQGTVSQLLVRTCHLDAWNSNVTHK